ncbi:MAG: TetR/AcrR family transcriptional regulator [Deltaproteobacteria bacterium]|nr:TetR/AcrR family transcriptional regulator [Deltaproteobacteria bacterium]
MKGEEKYKAILKAAKGVFAREGFYNSKVSEIAKEARVADGTIYLYFKNKEDILISLFEEELTRIIKLVKGELEQVSDPRDKLRRFCDIHLNMAEEDRTLAEVIQVELRQSNKFMREYKNKYFLAYLKIVADIIDEGKASGIFDQDVRSDVVARMVFGSLDEISTYWVTSRRKRFDVHDAAKTVGDILIEGLVSSH